MDEVFGQSDRVRLDLQKRWRTWTDDAEANQLAFEGFSAHCGDLGARVRFPRVLSSADWLAPPEGAAPTAADLSHWRCVVPGPAGTVWEGARIPLILCFPEGFPVDVPTASFAPGFFHANVFTDGKVFCRRLRTTFLRSEEHQYWQPTVPVKMILRAIQAALGAPIERTVALEEPAWVLYTQNRAAYDARELLEAQKYGAPARNAHGLRAGSLGADFGGLLASGEGADVTLVCGTARVAAHKLVLCARSSVFSAQLSGALAADPNSVPVHADMDEHTLRRMLSFIYTGELKPASVEEAQHLLNAADVYALPGLLELCEPTLIKGLCVENAAVTLALAEQHNVTRPKAAVLRFVARHGVAVMATPGWAHLRQAAPTVMEQLFHTALAGLPLEPRVRAAEALAAAEGEGRAVRRRTG